MTQEQDPSAPPPQKADAPEKTTDLAPYHPAYAALMVDRGAPEGIHHTTWAYACCIVDVHQWIADNQRNNVQLGCEETGWPRHVYYSALRDPEAAQLAKGALLTIRTAGALMVEGRWVQVVSNMLDIASTQSGVAAVRAASWLKDLLRDQADELEELIEAGKDGKRGEESAAAMMLAQFPPSGRFKRTKTVTETVEVEPDAAIDVTPG